MNRQRERRRELIPVSGASPAPGRRRRRRHWPVPPLLVLAAVITAAAAGILLWMGPEKSPDGPAAAASAAVTEPPPSAEPSEPAAAELPDWVRQNLLPVNEYSRPGTALSQVNGVVVHYVGNPGTTAEQNRSYFANLAETHETWASSHFVIGIDGTVIQCVPLDEIAYCSNDRNDDTISIECCHPDDSGAFSEETVNALVRLLDWLIETYRLEREDILRHYDVNGKECPRYYVRDPEAWQALLDQLTFADPDT